MMDAVGSPIVTNGLYLLLLIAAVATFVANLRSAEASEKSARASEDNAKAAARLSDDTRELLAATVAASQMAERHHQENIRPILVLEADLRVTNFKSSSIPMGLNDLDFHLEGLLRNVGGGPAISISFVLIPSGHAPKELNLLVAVPANSNTPISLTWPSQAIGFHKNGDPWPFESVLGYSTIAFTTRAGVTKQRSHSGLARDITTDYVKPTDDNIVDTSK